MEDMEVQLDQQQGDLPANHRRNVLPFKTPRTAGGLSREEVGRLLEQWRSRELREIRGWVQCRGLGVEQLEDIYQETLLELLARPHGDEEHLRYALRSGIRMRALNMRRDELRHEEILASSQPEMRLLADARQALEQPESVVLAEEDRLIAWDFMSELDKSEQRTYELMVDGMSYHRIARVRGIPVNDARRLVRSCERKRDTFQLLYESGRLCGYRAGTIRSLQNGELGSQELAERAFAHLESCAHCRVEHKTNADRLRRSFRDQAAALLPGPLVAGHLPWPEKLGLRARLVQHRLVTGDLPFAGSGGGAGVRERAGALLAGGGLAAKLATGTATLALFAGGAISATRALEHHARGQQHQPVLPAGSTVDTPPGELLQASLASPVSVRHTTRLSPATPRHVAASATVKQHEPGGFAYLGIPAVRQPPVRSPRRTSGTEQKGGGPFSP